MDISGLTSALANACPQWLAQAASPQGIASPGATAFSYMQSFGTVLGIPAFEAPSVFRAVSSTLLAGPVGARTNLGGKDYIYFGGTNYLGLANHPLIKAASILATLSYGTSSSASRATTGTRPLHCGAEQKIADFMDAEDACLMPSGLHANLALMDILSLQSDVVFCERRMSHPSLMAAARTMFGAEARSFDLDHLPNLARNIRRHSISSAVVALNGVDPASGRIAPLDRIAKALSGLNVRVLVDDCHGVGVLGENGRGTPEYFGIEGGLVFQSATMSKAFGCHCGFVVGSLELCNAVRKTQAYKSASAVPPSEAAACLMAAVIADANPSLRARLFSNVAYAVSGLRARGFEIMHEGTPIIVLAEPTGAGARALCDRLRQRGIYVSNTNYPDGGGIDRVRIVISASHRRRDIDALLEAFPGP
jgi:7-keto-8-aminopelargonate synthetase-like enzyme